MGTLCPLTTPATLSVIGLVLDLVGTLLIVSPLFLLRPRQVVRGDKRPMWSREDDPEAKLLRRQLGLAIPGAVILTLGVALQIIATLCPRVGP